MKKDKYLLPRLIRLRDVPYYLGMDRTVFNREVRPFLTEIPIGTQGKAFDRLDLDQWVDYYKKRSGRPSNFERLKLWDVKERQDSTNAENSGISINEFSDKDFAKALTLSRSKKRKST